MIIGIAVGVHILTQIVHSQKQAASKSPCGCGKAVVTKKVRQLKALAVFVLPVVAAPASEVHIISLLTIAVSLQSER